MDICWDDGSNADTSPQARPREAALISVVAPAFNEIDNLEPFVSRVVSVLRMLAYPFEIVLVDDGGSDGSWARMVELSRAFPELRCLRLSRNFGHQRALLAGLAEARGEAVISMDSDLQHPPEILPELLAKWRAGHDIVLTQRCDGAETGAFKAWSSRMFYRWFSKLADFPVHPGASDFRLVARAPLDVLLQVNHTEPFLRGSIERIGFPKTIVPFDVAPRFAGTSKYTLRRMLRFAFNALIAHSTVPLRLGIWIGVATSLLAFLQLAYTLVQAMLGNTVPGWASTIGVMSLLFGVVFVLLGIIGTYVASIHDKLKADPVYIVAERAGGSRTTADGRTGRGEL